MHKDLTLKLNYYQFLKSLIHLRNTPVTKIKTKNSILYRLSHFINQNKAENASISTILHPNK